MSVDSRCARQVMFLTRSVDRSALLHSAFNTSSQAYEVALVKALSDAATVSVLNVGSLGIEQRSNHLEITATLTYKPYGAVGLSPFSGLYFDLIKARKRSSKVVALTTGYYPMEMLLLIWARFFGIKSYSIVFDSHLAATRKMGWLKRPLLNLYFGVGYSLLKKLNGIVVLNEGFVERDRLTRMKILKSRIGGLFRRDPDVAVEGGTASADGEVKMLFAGTINNENGVGVILEALRLNRNFAVKVTFYGDGDASGDVFEAAKEDSRIAIIGRVSDSELDKQILKSNYLICLRDPESIASYYSFPSKLIKFMGSGVPVIANKFPGLDESFNGRLILTSGFSGEALAGLLPSLSNTGLHGEIGKLARDHIAERHDWVVIAEELADFVFFAS